MRGREHSYSGGYIQEIDRTKNRRNLTPIHAAEYIALIPFGAACAIEAVHQNLRIPRREVVRQLRDGARFLVDKDFREKVKEEDRVAKEEYEKHIYPPPQTRPESDSYDI